MSSLLLSLPLSGMAVRAVQPGVAELGSPGRASIKRERAGGREHACLCGSCMLDAAGDHNAPRNACRSIQYALAGRGGEAQLGSFRGQAKVAWGAVRVALSAGFHRWVNLTLQLGAASPLRGVRHSIFRRGRRSGGQEGAGTARRVASTHPHGLALVVCHTGTGSLVAAGSGCSLMFAGSPAARVPAG